MVLSMDRWKGKLAVVTGAGGGMGEQIVKHLLQEGLKVVAVDNRAESLENLSKSVQNQKNLLYTFAVDITKESEVANLFKRIQGEIGLVYILVNCAGIIQQTDLIGGDVKKWQKVFDVNVMGLCMMTSQAAEIMKDNHIEGHIIHIASNAAYTVSNYPGLNVYSASKHAVRALTETLRLEFNNLGLKIKITCLSPGGTATGIAANNDVKFGLSGQDAKSRPLLKPEDIADAVVYVLSTPPHVQVQELLVKSVGEKN